MSLFRQLALVAALCGLGFAAYEYGWPLVAPTKEPQAERGQRGANPTATVLVEKVVLGTERTRIEAVGTARAHRSITLHPATRR